MRFLSPLSKRPMKPLPSDSTDIPASFDPARLRKLIWLVAGVFFMENLDGTIIATALPTMARSFGRTAIELNVGVSAYLMALGVFIPASGWVADRFGTRRVFASAIIIFTLASALCGMASGLGEFVAARILQGVGGAMMVPVGRLVILKNTRKQDLMAAMSMLVWPALIAPVLGPPLGGFIVSHASWRWIFYLNLPLGLVALALALLLVPNMRGAERRPFDAQGFLLSGAGIFLLLAGMEHIVAAVDPLTLGLLGSGLLLVALAVRHFRRAAAPMVDLSSLSIATFAAALRGGSFSRMAIGSAPFLLPLMFQVGFGYGAFQSGLLVLAVFAGNLTMKSMTTPVLKRFGFRPVLIVTCLINSLTLAACALLTPGTPILLTVVILFAGGLVRSMQFTAFSTIAFSDVPQPRLQGANGLFSTIFQISMGAGIALGALAVRIGHVAATELGLSAPGIDYRFAFLIVAGVGLLALIDVLRLPKGAGDHMAR